MPMEKYLQCVVKTGEAWATLTLEQRLVKFQIEHVQTCTKKNLFIVTKHSDVIKAALGNTKIENIITDYESLLQYSHEESCVLT